MLIKDLKEIIKDLPNDADIIMQKRISKESTLFSPVIKHRIGLIEDEKGVEHHRLILVNDVFRETNNV